VDDRLDDLAELFPLFLSEARGRVRQLVALAPQLVSSPGALATARRELHTLRGASRLIGFVWLADLSLEGEELLETVDGSTAVELAALADRMEHSLSDFEAAGFGALPGAAAEGEG
jgi:chemotaxis protein histidine kinase CheA